MRVLYVEDNEVNQALVARVMRAKQCQVLFREEGEGALEILANDPDIDLVLLDIELAGAMSGLDVIRTLRARNDRRPVVAITAYAMMGDRERILEAGCDQYLPKPLVIPDLLDLLDEYEQQFAAKASASAAPEPAPAPAASTPDESASVTAAVVTGETPAAAQQDNSASKTASGTAAAETPSAAQDDSASETAGEADPPTVESAASEARAEKPTTTAPAAAEQVTTGSAAESSPSPAPETPAPAAVPQRTPAAPETPEEQAHE